MFYTILMCISCFVLLMTFIVDCRNDVRQKANSNNFKFKMGRKAAETTHKVNSALGPGTANERTVQWWFKKFCKGDERPENEKHSDQPSEVDNKQVKGSLKLILLQLQQKLLKNSASTIL